MFKVGDMVRIKEKHKVFAKDDELTYSKDSYIIDSINANRIKLKGINDKTYKPYELIKVNSIEYKPTVQVEEKIEHEKDKVEKADAKAQKQLGIEKANIQDKKRRPQTKSKMLKYIYQNE